MPKKLNIFGLRLRKGTGIFKQAQNLFKKGKHKEIILRVISCLYLFSAKHS